MYIDRASLEHTKVFGDRAAEPVYTTPPRKTTSFIGGMCLSRPKALWSRTHDASSKASQQLLREHPLRDEKQATREISRLIAPDNPLQRGRGKAKG